MKALLLLLTALASAPAAAQTAAPAAPASPARTIEVPFTQFTLPNGLHVILHEDHSVPIVTVNMWYHVGSSRERPGRTGFAHLFEHLMFMGSGHVKPSEFDTLLEAAGGDNNGSTENDRTNYWINVPSNALDLALFLESDRMGFLLDTMTPQTVDAQRDVVKNERRQSYENRPYGMAEITLSEMLFPEGHPYHWPVIGYMPDLTAASYEDVVAFFKHITPANASLVVAGDINMAGARALVEKWFGDVKAGPAVAPLPIPPVALTSVQKKTISDRVQLPRLFLAWLTPRHFEAGDAALDVVADVLAGGKNSRLYKRLVYDLQVAQDVRAQQSSGRLASYFQITVTPRPGHTADEMQRIVDEEIVKLQQEGPTAHELNRSMNQIEASFFNRMERVGGFGGKGDQLNAYYTETGNPDGFNQDLRRYRVLTTADIRAAATTYLPRDRRVELTVPEEEAIAMKTAKTLRAWRALIVTLAGTAVAVAAQSPDRSRPPAPGAPPTLNLPAIQKRQLANGLPVWIVELHEVPVAQVNLLVMSGALEDPPGKFGVTSLMTAMLEEGAGTRSSLEISDAIDFLGADLGAGSTFDASAVRLHVPVARLADALPILADVALRPTFPADELERLRSQRLTSLLQARDDPGTIVAQAFPRIVFGASHRYGTGTAGTAVAIASMTTANLRTQYAAVFRPANSALIVVGDIVPDRVMPLLETHFGGWRPPAAATGSPADQPARLQSRQARRGREVSIVDKPGAAQTQIRIGAVGVARSTPDYFPLQVMNTILGGSFTSRLNMNLREKRGYTYGASSAFDMRALPGPFTAAAGVQTDKTSEALKEFFIELNAIRQPVPADELARAKHYVSLRFPSAFESTTDISRRLEDAILYKLPDDYFSRYVANIEAVTAADVLRVAQKYIQPARLAVVVVGDRKVIEPGIRTLNLGPIKIVGIDEVFGPAPKLAP